MEGSSVAEVVMVDAIQEVIQGRVMHCIVTKASVTSQSEAAVWAFWSLKWVVMCRTSGLRLGVYHVWTRGMKRKGRMITWVTRVSGTKVRSCILLYAQSASPTTVGRACIFLLSGISHFVVAQG